jgi:hypothetical protein
MQWDLTDVSGNALLNRKVIPEDRKFQLKIKDGCVAKQSVGLVDHRLFNGNNYLHGVRDPNSSLWYWRYEKGQIPEVLMGRYTKFSNLYAAAVKYFEGRNVELIELIDGQVEQD